VRFKGQEFENWSEYFRWLFSTDGRFNPPKTTTKNQANIETYTFQDNTIQTEIVVTFLKKNGKLIHYEIINPLTTGYTAYQKKSSQYFEQGHFADPPEYGNPGLDFDLRNLNGIDKELNAGLDGQEVQYISEGKIIKSTVKLSKFTSEYTYRFDDKGLFKRLGQKLRGIDEETELVKKTIDLREIFNGISRENDKL
jgi:hypothetical protein